jgi:phage RecT family recombinase
MTHALVEIPQPVLVPGVSSDLLAKQETFRAQLTENLPQLAAVLPRGVRAEAMASASLTAALDNPALLDCSPLSLFRSVLKMATLGLRIGETCDIVPIQGKAECWVRVKGVVELAIRAGAIKFAREGYVSIGDEFEHEETESGTKFRHRVVNSPALDASNLTHVYAIITLATGERIYEVWKLDRVLAHRDKHAKDKSPKGVWARHPLPMMAKTVLKSALRFAPLSPEVRGAIGTGDEVEASFEIVGDPTAALNGAAGAFDALDALEAGKVPALAAGPVVDVSSATPRTLAEAEAMLLPGDSSAWGGRGGQPLANLSEAKLNAVRGWIAKDEQRRDRYAGVNAACEMILDARADADETAALAAAGASLE